MRARRTRLFLFTTRRLGKNELVRGNIAVPPRLEFRCYLKAICSLTIELFNEKKILIHKNENKKHSCMSTLQLDLHFHPQTDPTYSSDNTSSNSSLSMSSTQQEVLHIHPSICPRYPTTPVYASSKYLSH